MRVSLSGRSLGFFRLLLCTLFITSAFITSAFGQERAAMVAQRPALITSAVDERQLTVLKGNTHPLARPEFDLGRAPASLPMNRMLLVLKRNPEQESALEKLLDDQQDKNSSNYHKWLTPEEFGQKFGPTDADIQTVTGWLQSHGFQVGTTKGRSVLEFSGSASQVQEAFHTTIHKYIVNGEQHWANANDPSIPAALAPAIAGIASLNDFPRKPLNVPLGNFVRDKATGRTVPMKPLFTFGGGCDQNGNCYALGPYDFAKIYDVLPLWTGTSKIDGTGQTIAIVGESNINPQDVTDFRTMFGLVANGYPANNVSVILNGPDPGLQGDETEADIDVQWSGAVAPNATIDFVVSQTTETTLGVDLSALYIVENNLAPVMSESYGLCELALGTTGNQFYSTLWQQAAAQGITVLLASGDSGSATCDYFQGTTPQPATNGLAVSGFASTPYNVAVGGTDFNDLLNPTTYWSATNDPTTQASAIGYIPEVAWNDTCTNGILASFGWSASAETNCNDSRLSGLVWTIGGGGGASNCTTPSGSTPASCSGGYAKPSWQTGTGVPNDGKRDIPDVSLFASNGFMGNFYVICQSDATSNTCNTSSSFYFVGLGGTSVAAPAFAGIMAMVNQQMATTNNNPGERQGNANYVLYKLAKQQPTAFHDVASGTIAMPCATGSTNCKTSTTGHAYGLLSGYNTTAGYDLATGLGSVDATNLVAKWNSVTLLPSVTTLSNVTPTTLTHGQAVSFTVSVKPQTGTGTPTGLISLEGGATNSSQGIAGFNLSNGSVTGSTHLLSGGSYSLIAHYPGDSTYAPSDSAAIPVTVTPENSQTQLELALFDWNGIFTGYGSSAVYGSPYLLRVNVQNSSGQMCVPPGTSSTAPSTGCPTGTVTLTDNGSPLDAGTYTLNSYGYFEDQSVQLSGGANQAVAASYSGDNSFNPSKGSANITITPAATTIGQPATDAFGTVGAQLSIGTQVQASSTGVPPAGTVTFYCNGTPITGTTTYSGFSIASARQVFLNVNFTSTTSPFTAPGTYTITAQYNGDNNYASSVVSTASQVAVKYPTPTLNVTPYNQTINYGATATVSVLVDSTNKTAYPTGTITFAGVSGPVTCSNATDTSGNYACQATVSFTVTSGGSIQVQYSGDANYPSSYSWAYINMPDFRISPEGGVQVTAGQTQNVVIDIQSQSGLSGTVTNFACSGLPAEATCTFGPTQLSLPSDGTASTTVTVTTAAMGQSRKTLALGNRSGMYLQMGGSVFLLGLCFAGLPLSRRRRILTAVVLAMALVVTPGCGGGGGSGGGGGGPPNPVPFITSISPTQVAAGSQIQSLYINGSNFLSTSTVTYNGTLHNSSLQSPTQIQIALGPADVATTGKYAVVVSNPSPGGGSSSPVNFSVVTGTPTGVFYVTITATVGPITHSTNMIMYVQ
jgi:hypothetical protein